MLWQMVVMYSLACCLKNCPNLEPKEICVDELCFQVTIELQYSLNVVCHTLMLWKMLVEDREI